MTDIHDAKFQRFTVYTIDGYEGEHFVWDPRRKVFESDWVEWDGRTGAFIGRKIIPLGEVVEYITESRERKGGGATDKKKL